MISGLRFRLQILTLFCVFPLAAVRGVAQGRPGGGGPGGVGPGGGRMGSMGGMDRPTFPVSGGSPNSRGMGNSPPPRSGAGGPTESTMGGGLQLGPPGRWWDNNDFAKNLNIDARQQHRMDDVFSANRTTLVTLYKSLQQEEKQLAKTIRAKDLDENAIFAQIDRVTQARGELEKANAHMLLQIRKEMSPEQNAKLDEHRQTPED